MRGLPAFVWPCPPAPVATGPVVNLDFMQYIYKGDFVIGYMDGDRTVYLSTPIPACMIND